MATTSAGLGLEEISSKLNTDGRKKRTPKTIEEAQQMEESENILRYGGSGKGRKFLYGIASAIVGEDNAKKVAKKYGNREEQEKAFENIYGKEKKVSKKTKTTERIPTSELKEYLEEFKKSLDDISEIKDIVERIEKRISPRDVTIGKGVQAQTYRFDPLAPLEKQVTEVNETGLAGSFAGKKETAAVLSKAAYFGNKDLVAKKEQEDLRKGITPESTEPKETQTKKTKKVERKANVKPTVEKVQPVQIKEIIKEIKQQFKITNKLIVDTAKKNKTGTVNTQPKSQRTNELGKPKFNTFEEYEEYQNKLEEAKDTVKFGGTGFGKKFIYGFRQQLLGDKYAQRKARENANKEQREEALRLLNPAAFQPKETTNTQTAPDVKPTTQPKVEQQQPENKPQEINSPNPDVSLNPTKTVGLETKVDTVVEATKDIPTVKDSVERIEKRVSPRDITVGKGDQAQTFRFDPLAPEGKQVTEVQESGLAGGIASKEGGGRSDYEKVVSKAAYLGNQDLVVKKEQEDKRKIENEKVEEISTVNTEPSKTPIIAEIKPEISADQVVQTQAAPMSETTTETIPQQQQQIEQQNIPEVKAVQQTNIPNIESEVIKQTTDTNIVNVENKLNSVIENTKQIPEINDAVGRVEKRVSPRDITVGKGEDAETLRFDPLAPEGKQVTQITKSGLSGGFADKTTAASVLSKAAYLGNQDMVDKKEQEDLRKLQEIEAPAVPEIETPAVPTIPEIQAPVPEIQAPAIPAVPQIESEPQVQTSSISHQLETKVDQIIQTTKDLPEVKDGVQRIEKRVSPRDINIGKGKDEQTYRFDPLAPEGKQVTEVKESGLAGSFAGKKEEAAVLSKAAYLGNQDMVAKKEQQDLRKLENEPQVSEAEVKPAPQTQLQQQEQPQKTLEQRQTENEEKTNKLIKEVKEQLTITNKLIVSSKTIGKSLQTGQPTQGKQKFASGEEFEAHQQEVEKAKDIVKFGGTGFAKKFAFGFKEKLLGEKFARKSAAKNANKEEREKALRLLNPDKIQPASQEGAQPPTLPNAQPNPEVPNASSNLQGADLTQQTPPNVTPVPAPNISGTTAEAESATSVALQREAAESQKEDRESVIEKLTSIEKKIDELLEKDDDKGGILGGIAKVLGVGALAEGAAVAAGGLATAASAALPALAVAGAGAAGYVAGKGIDKGVEALTGREASDWVASGVGAITGQNAEGNEAVHAGESSFKQRAETMNSKLKGTGYELVSPGKYKGPDGKIISQSELPAEVKDLTKPGAMPNAQGVVEGKINRPEQKPAATEAPKPAPATPPPAQTEAPKPAPTTPPPAQTEQPTSETSNQQQPKVEQPKLETPAVVPVAPMATGPVTSESKEKQQQDKITTLTAENAVLKSQQTAAPRAARVPRVTPPPPPPQQKKEKKEDTTIIQIRNVEQSVATYTASIFDHPVVHPGIYKM